MAGKTPRFGLNYFGGGTPGTVTDDGQKFTGSDRLMLDRLLASVETHTHKVRPPTEGVIEAPTGTLHTSGGQLAAGYTYYYKVGLVDGSGNETLASPQVAVATPTPLPPPGMPSLSAAEGTGTLTPGFYYYALTGLRDTEESTLGAASMVSLIEGESSVGILLPPLGDAEAFAVWRMGSTEPGYTRIGTTSGAEFVDTGAVPADPCACDPGVAPPAYNTGVSSFSITVTLPESVDLTNVISWRLYRTVHSNIYESASLVHDVVEREDEWDESSPLQRAWTDTGGPLVNGSPMTTDQNMRFQPFTMDGLPALPDPAGYPEFYPMIVDKKFYVLIDGVWELAGGAGGGGGGGGGGIAEPPIMTAPGGARFLLTVDDAGVLTTVPTQFPGAPTPVQNVSVI